MEKIDKKAESGKNKDYYDMKVDLEFKQLCDEYAKKINEFTWNAIKYSYKEITKILARKLREARLI